MAQQTQINRLIELGVAQVNINARDLGLAIAALAQESARARVAAAAPDALIDGTGGVSVRGEINLTAVVTPTAALVDNVAQMAPKASFDTQIGNIEDAHQELVELTNEFIGLIGGAAAATVANTAGAAGDGTLGAITVALAATTANGEAVPAQDGKVQINTARNNQAAITSAINWCRVAVGLDVITDNTGGVFDRTQSQYVTTDAAEVGAAAANGENALTLATTNAALGALRDNIAALAAALAQMTAAIDIGPFVVATNNPRTRFAAVDVSG